MLKTQQCTKLYVCGCCTPAIQRCTFIHIRLYGSQQFLDAAEAGGLRVDVVSCRGLWRGQLRLQGSGWQLGMAPMKPFCWSRTPPGQLTRCCADALCLCRFGQRARLEQLESRALSCAVCMPSSSSDCHSPAVQRGTEQVGDASHSCQPESKKSYQPCLAQDYTSIYNCHLQAGLSKSQPSRTPLECSLCLCSPPTG